MPDWKIRRGPTIQTELEVPGDKSISHRAVMLAAMSNGTCVIRGFLPSEDCLCTVAAMRALGIQIERMGSKSRMDPFAKEGMGISATRLNEPKFPYSAERSALDWGAETAILTVRLVPSRPMTTRTASSPGFFLRKAASSSAILFVSTPSQERIMSPIRLLPRRLSA